MKALRSSVSASARRIWYCQTAGLAVDDHVHANKPALAHGAEGPWARRSDVRHDGTVTSAGKVCRTCLADEGEHARSSGSGH